jgi:hypothetical protein
MKRRQLLLTITALASGCGGGSPNTQQEVASPASFKSPLLHKDGVWLQGGLETAVVVFNGELLAITFLREILGSAGFLLRVSHYLGGHVLAEHPWPGGMGCAVVKGGVIHIFGNTDWAKPGNKIIHSTLGADFTPSAPTDALLMNASDKPFKFYNTSITADQNGFRMVVETTSGTFFARSTDLDTWSFHGGELNAGKYIGCPSIHYISGTHWLTYLHHMGDGRYETRVAHSKDDCFTFTYGKALLSPEPFDGLNCSDVDMVEFNGKVYGVFLDGDQSTWGRLRRWGYEGSLAQMFSDYS